MPIRMCVVCRERHEKKQLKRVVKQDGKIKIDKKAKIQCRGIYICPDCVLEAQKKRIFERVFKQKVEPLVYEEFIAEATKHE